MRASWLLRLAWVVLALPVPAFAQSEIVVTPSARDLQVGGNLLTYRRGDGSIARLDVRCATRTAFAWEDFIYVGCIRGEIVVVRPRAAGGSYIERRFRVPGNV